MNNKTEEVRFTVNDKELNGILTRPLQEDPCPAIVLLHGSDRSGKDSLYYSEHAEQLFRSGVAVLCYDGPGWGGGSSQGKGFETLEYRTEEAIAAVKYLQSRPDIKPNAVGLWGVSQGGWICQMSAAIYGGVAFIIPVSGPGVTPVEQEAYRVEMESRAAGFDEDEIAKATLMRRLMIDAVVVQPLYQETNQFESQRLGNGAWSELTALMYGTKSKDPAVELEKVVENLESIKDERWAKFLHLDEVLTMLGTIPPQAWEMAKAQMRAIMDVNPSDFLTKVRCPVLAIFGEKDTSIPVEKSVRLYEQYLRKAGNEAFVLKVFPNASHTIRVGDTFADGYFDLMVEWLGSLRFDD